MQTTFLNAAGVVLFARDDMEQGEWTQEEYTVNATFPYVAGKVIERGQRIAFRDPATDTFEVFEIRNVTNIEPEHYQQIIAEHIAVSELSDEHINTQEITDKTPTQALQTILTGTLWAVGNVSVSRTSTCDVSRGNVWQAVCTVAANWNVYITPRVATNSAGAITGRYLDVTEAQGTWRGVRLSIVKNMSDSAVAYDDSEVYTALYGYGGTVDTTQTGQDDGRQELTFADVVWTQTTAHPAKPAGQTYLEDPTATALYGRNGRARFGYYQNSGISDANVLLEKTWESLKTCNHPKINISGTVADLYRLGYKDEPIRLHDLAIVEIQETGELFQLQIIKLSVDLIDPTATRPEIGAYIPNIIYINRETDANSSGGGGGGGRSPGSETNQYNTYATLESNTDEYGSMIAMVVGRRNGNNYVKAGEIGLAINQSGTSGSYETTAYINADHVNISGTSTVYTLAGDIEHDANGRLVIKNASGMYVERTESGTTAYFGVWDRGNLDGGVMVQQINGQTQVKISGDVIDITTLALAINASTITINADRIDINGIIESIEAANVMFEHFNAAGGEFTDDLSVLGTVTCVDLETGDITCNAIDTQGNGITCGSLTVGAHGASWQSANITTYSLGTYSYFNYSTNGGTTPLGTRAGYLVTGSNVSTIYYLGR